MQASTDDPILQLERKALDRWVEGDIARHSDLYADDVTYFDPLTRARIDGLQALSAYSESPQGQNDISRYEVTNPHIVNGGELALLTYNLTTYEHGADGEEKLSGNWNCTEVYRKRGKDWKIIHSHWSHTAHEAFIAEAQPPAGEASS